jgi:hypothetical protein
MRWWHVGEPEFLSWLIQAPTSELAIHYCKTRHREAKSCHLVARPL